MRVSQAFFVDPGAFTTLLPLLALLRAAKLFEELLHALWVATADVAAWPHGAGGVHGYHTGRDPLGNISETSRALGTHGTTRGYHWTVPGGTLGPADFRPVHPGREEHAAGKTDDGGSGKAES
jgi:hypothetical protein